MSKKLIALVLCLMLSLTATSSALAFAAVAKEDLKVGFVFIGPKDDGFTGAHYAGAEGMKETLGLTDEQVLYKFNIPEDGSCEAALRELADEGCQIIFGASWGYMNYMEEIAEEYPEVIFSHFSGYKNNGENFNNYFGRIYQPRYLAGIAAGLKTQSNLIGYVAAWPENAEVASGINAFALGIQSVNPDAVVYVKYINSWGDPTLEKQTAQALIDLGCDVIAQHCDSVMPQVAAEENGVYGCGYNKDMTADAPAAHLTAPIWNWNIFYTMEVEKVLNGTWTCENSTPGMETGFVELSPLSENCAEGTAEAIDAVAAKIIAGEWDVFTGPIYNNQGELMIAEGAVAPYSDIMGDLMAFNLVQGVEVK